MNTYFSDKVGFGKLNISAKAFSGNGEQYQLSYGTKATASGLRAFAKSKEWEDEISVTPAPFGVIVKRSFKNVSKKTLTLKELGFTIDGLNFGLNPKDDYFYSLENPRIYETFTFPIDYSRTADDAANSDYDVVANNRWADPGVVCERINYSPYQPFPAILLSNYKGKQGIVCGTLSQDVFFHNYIVKHTENKITLDIYSSFKALAYMEVEAGRTLFDSWYLGRTEHADDINCIFDEYTDVLRREQPVLCQSSDANKHDLVWGSWNDGISRKISHEMLIEEAKALKEQFRCVKWFQVDDGYAAHNARFKNLDAHGIGVPYEGEEGIDKEKFPKGLRKLTDEIREIGLRPAVWIGGYAPIKAKIYEEHPEWFFDYNERLTEAKPFDVSIPEAREYMVKALDVFLKDYGFDAVKHDFWSYPYESSGDYYKNKTKSGYEYREWWCRTVHERLDKDAYFQTGCDVVMGNPFHGKYFTNYRYGIDVGGGRWDYISTDYMWGSACFATHTGDMIIPNSDGVGLFTRLNDTDFMFWTNYVLITRSMVELAGRFSRPDVDKNRVAILHKATCNINNGQNVYYAHYDYRVKGKSAPDVMYIHTPHFSVEQGKCGLPLKTVGLFNVTDADRKVYFTAKELGLPDGKYILTDIWSGEQYEIKEGYEEVLLPHGSRLFHINAADGLSIYDSDIKISEFEQLKDGFKFISPFGGKANIKLSFVPSKVLVNGQEIEFTYSEKNVTFVLPDNAAIEIREI